MAILLPVSSQQHWYYIKFSKFVYVNSFIFLLFVWAIMPWVVVKFLTSNEIEAIPSSWVDQSKTLCFYPNEDDKGFVKTCIKKEALPQPSWETYQIKLMVKEEYSSLKTASAVASKACVTSDLEESTALPQKRIPKKKIFSDNSSNEGSDDSLYGAPSFPGRLCINAFFCCVYQHNKKKNFCGLYSSSIVSSTTHVCGTLNHAVMVAILFLYFYPLWSCQTDTGWLIKYVYKYYLVPIKFLYGN